MNILRSQSVRTQERYIRCFLIRVLKARESKLKTLIRMPDIPRSKLECPKGQSTILVCV